MRRGSALFGAGPLGAPPYLAGFGFSDRCESLLGRLLIIPVPSLRDSSILRPRGPVGNPPTLDPRLRTDEARPFCGDAGDMRGGGMTIFGGGGLRVRGWGGAVPYRV